MFISVSFVWSKSNALLNGGGGGGGDVLCYKLFTFLNHTKTDPQNFAQISTNKTLLASIVN